MKKSELKNIIKEELKSVLNESPTDRIKEDDITAVVGTFLSKMINDNFMKFMKSGYMDSLPISGLSSVGAHRVTKDTVEFVIEPKNLKDSTIRITLQISPDMRRYNLIRNKGK